VTSVRRTAIRQGDRTLELEYRWAGSGDADAPLVVFLHEGLGSVAMWRDFPDRLCDSGGLRGLIWSRAGYGRSTARLDGERWGADFMQRQAREVLPPFLQALGVDTAREPPWLFGHSDGASIALLYAADFPGRVAGLIVLAPHIFVEDLTIANIEQARETFRSTDLRARLARYHDDVDSAFWGWNDVWLSAQFRPWNIESSLPSIRCPVLAMQGCDDEYGTMAQIDGIARALPGTLLLRLASCGHSPHRDQPEAVIAATVAFIAAQRAADAKPPAPAASAPASRPPHRSAGSE
jgi:pimeloyl-ACP methyl ester carboxylesterase